MYVGACKMIRCYEMSFLFIAGLGKKKKNTVLMHKFLETELEMCVPSRNLQFLSLNPTFSSHFLAIALPAMYIIARKQGMVSDFPHS